MFQRRGCGFAAGRRVKKARSGGPGVRRNCVTLPDQFCADALNSAALNPESLGFEGFAPASRGEDTLTRSGEA
jgi:hypothetical protein